MIATLEAAICDALGSLPGVATSRPYAGELLGQVRVALSTPALLVAAARLRLLPDPGTGQLLARTYWSVFACTRQAESAEARGQTAWALAVQVLLRVHGETWGVPGVSPALLGAPDRLVEDEAGAVLRWEPRVAVQRVAVRALGVGVIALDLDLIWRADGGALRLEGILIGPAARVAVPTSATGAARITTAGNYRRLAA